MTNIKLALILSILQSHIYLLECHVTELDERTFPGKSGHWLVMFYAPWCGHCKHLEPIWRNVGEKLAAVSQEWTGQKIGVGKLDATKFSSLASQHQIRGFPTIKFFKDGDALEYNGARNDDSIISFVKRASGPAVQAIHNLSALKHAIDLQPVIFVYIGHKETELWKMYEEVAASLYTEINFYEMHSSFLPEELKRRGVYQEHGVLADLSPRSTPSLLVFKDGQHHEIPTLPPSSDYIKAWVRSEQVASYVQLQAANYATLRGTGKKLVIAVLEEREESDLNATVRDLALQRSLPYFTFCWVLGSAVVRNLVYGTIPTPNVVVFEPSTRVFYPLSDHSPFRYDQPWTESDIKQFLEEVEAGNVVGQGGNGFWMQAKRLFTDFIRAIVVFFTESPIVASVVVVLPTVLVLAMCVCLCTLPVDDSGELASDEFDSEDDEGAEFGDDGKGKEPVAGATGDGGAVPPPSGEAACDEAGETGGEGLRKRVKIKLVTKEEEEVVAPEAGEEEEENEGGKEEENEGGKEKDD